MRNIRVVSTDTVGNNRWLKAQNYFFAAEHNFVPLGLRELTLAIHAMPVCFARSPEGFHVGGLTGFESNENLFVGRNGAWLGSYCPIAYRTHPFHMVNLSNGSQAVGINEENVVDSNSAGELFFDEEGKPTPLIQEVAKMLGDYGQQLKVTRAACSVLAEKDMLEPWSLQIQGEEKVRTIGSLYRINETRLRELPAVDLGHLRTSGALMLAYAQLLSMTQVQQVLVPLSRQKMHAVSQSEALLPSGLGDSGLVSFDNL